MSLRQDLQTLLLSVAHRRLTAEKAQNGREPGTGLGAESLSWDRAPGHKRAVLARGKPAVWTHLDPMKLSPSSGRSAVAVKERILELLGLEQFSSRTCKHVCRHTTHRLEEAGAVLEDL